MFNADEGLIHFTFANEDVYVKDSLLLLDRQGSLYYELKKRYYHTVLFLDLDKENYRITCADSAARELYEQSREQGIFAKFISELKTTNGAVQEQKSTVYMIPREQKEMLIGVLDRMMSNSRETAFVLSIDAMASFQGISVAQRILKRQKTENCGNRNILLIVSDTQLNVSLDKFANPDGIFQTEAFPKIREIFQNYSNPRLYDCMKKTMPERVTYLNEMRWDELYHLAAWSVMKLGNHLPERMNRLDDYTDFLYLLTHSVNFSTKMRTMYPSLNQIFSVNDTRLFSVLQKNLSTNAAYEQMDLAIDAIRGENKTSQLIGLVQVTDKGSEYQNYLYRSDPILKALYALSFHRESRKADAKNRDFIQDIEQKLHMIRRELVKPRVISDAAYHANLQKYITYYVDCLQSADILKDYETMRFSLEALGYAVCKCEQECLKGKDGVGSMEGERKSRENKQQLCLEAHKAVLDFQSAIGEQKRRVRTYLLDFRNLTEQTEKLQKEIDSWDREYPDLKQRAMNTQDHSLLVEEYRSMKAEYVALEDDKKAISNNMKLIKMNLVEQKRTIAALRSEIHTIEDTVYTMTYHQFDSSHDFMYDMGEKIAKLRAANNSYFERLHKRANTQDLQFHADVELSDLDLDLDLDLEEEKTAGNSLYEELDWQEAEKEISSTN